METICPKCGEKIEIKLERSGGATGLEDMRHLTPMALNILKYMRTISPINWMSNAQLYRAFTQDHRSKCEICRGTKPGKCNIGFYKIGSFHARLSEMVGLGIIAMTKQKIEMRDPDTRTLRFVKKPVYMVIPEKADIVIKDEGRLENVKRISPGTGPKLV